MPTENVLVQVNSAANLSGFQALQGALSMSNLSILGLGVALGAVGEAAKKAVENTEAMEAAHLSLQQAAGATKESFSDLQAQFDAWAQANKGYIADQYDAETALASFVRAGNSEKDALRLLNDALDLSVIKHEDVSAAESGLEKALMGSGRALKDLGISTTEYDDIMKNKHLNTEQKHLALMTLIETKTRGGRDATTELSKSQQALAQDWQNLSTKAGPPLVKLEEDLVNQADQWYSSLDKLGKDDALWAKISDRLTALAGDARDLALYLGIAGTDKTYTADYDRRSTPPGAPKAAPKLLPKTPGRQNQGRASGGMVGAGEAYTVGEDGPETLLMGSESGQIVPHGGGRGGLTVVIQGGVFMDHGPTLDRLANKVARRLGYTTGR